MGEEVKTIKVQIELTNDEGKVETSELEVGPDHYLYRVFRDEAVRAFKPSNVDNVKVTRAKKATTDED